MITSPNVDFVPEPHLFEEDELRPRANGHFGLVDCFQWPQNYEKEYEYSVCIPHKDSLLTHAVAWYNPTRDDFIIPPGSKFAVGMLRDAKVKEFEQLHHFLRNCHHLLRS